MQLQPHVAQHLLQPVPVPRTAHKARHSQPSLCELSRHPCNLRHCSCSCAPSLGTLVQIHLCALLFPPPASHGAR